MLKSKISRLAAFAFVAAAPVLAFAQATTPETAITTGQAAVIAIIAVGGLALVTISLASVGWNVGVKFVKRLRGAS